jgi:hypothetical protein
MKYLRPLCATAVLTFALASSTFAGTIDCGVVAPPPPQSSVTGDIDCGVTAINGTSCAEAAYVGPGTELVLSALQSVLALF